MIHSLNEILKMTLLAHDPIDTSLSFSSFPFRMEFELIILGRCTTFCIKDKNNLEVRVSPISWVGLLQKHSTRMHATTRKHHSFFFALNEESTLEKTIKKNEILKMTLLAHDPIDTSLSFSSFPFRMEFELIILGRCTTFCIKDKNNLEVRVSPIFKNSIFS
ncbi:hypothetical protein ACJX0J_031199 [Zea mays]